MTSVSSSSARSSAAAQRAAIAELARAAYTLSASDARLRGRATRDPQALSLTHARALKNLAECGPMTIGAFVRWLRRPKGERGPPPDHHSSEAWVAPCGGRVKSV